MPSQSKSFGKTAKSQQSPNPFQEKWAKSNQTLLRKRSQSVAFAKRSGHNVFTDGRIGEKDPTLDEDNRYLYRLQRERAKRVRKSARFSLADDETPEGELGMSLQEFPSLPPADDSLLSDGDERGSADESEDEEELITLKQTNGEDEGEGGERTRQEIMDEVVQKSKMYKAQRQHEKHVTDEQTAKLDEDLPELMQMLAQSGAEYDRKLPKPSLTLKSKPHTHAIFEADATTSTPARADRKFYYDDVYRQLAGEKRARPSERLLTEVERAERERDRLMDLEMQRKSRMESMGDSDEEPEEQDKGKKGKTRKQKKGGDDLDDDFDIPASDETSASEEDENASDKDEDNEVSAEDDTERIKGVNKENPASFWDAVDHGSVPAMTDGGVEDVPFIFKRCPATSVELQQLMNGMTVEQRSLVLERLQTCFAESLNSARNRPKLERLVECMLFRVERLTEVDADHIACSIEEIDMLLGHLHKMGQKFESTISAWSRRKLFCMHNKLGSPNDSLSSAWKAGDVMVARAVGRLYPSSDIRHPITTPLALLLSESISMRRIQSVADVALGIFVATVLLEVVAGREGYSGELGKFVFEVLCALCPASTGTRARKLKGLFQAVETGSDETDSCLSMTDYLEMQANKDMNGDAHFQRKVAYGIIAVTEAMNFSGQHRNWDIMLSGLPIEKLAIPETRDRLSKLVSQSRVNRASLSLYGGSSRKAIFKSLNPKYTAESGVYRKRPKTSFQSKLHGDTSASAKRVTRALRKEERGLARDVRKEAQVVAASRAEEQRHRDDDRDRRHREVMSFFEHQQATWKAAEKRQKKLSGKKW